MEQGKIDMAKTSLKERYGVEDDDLDYIGYVDCCEIAGPGAVCMQFNIINPNHISFKSTVAFNNFCSIP